MNCRRFDLLLGIALDPVLVGGGVDHVPSAVLLLRPGVLGGVVNHLLLLACIVLGGIVGGLWSTEVKATNMKP